MSQIGNLPPTGPQVSATGGATVGKIGEHTVQIAGQTPLRLDKIKGNSLPFQGFTTATRINRAEAGMQANASSALHALARPGGSLKPADLLGGLKSFQTSLGRFAGLNRLTPVQTEPVGLAQMTRAVQGLSNADLTAVYQTFQSPQMALLKEALQAEVRANPANGDARAALSNLFDMEAVVLKDVSERILSVMDLADTPDADAALRQGHRFGERAHEGPDAHARDISPRNMKTLVETTAQSATRNEREQGLVQGTLADRRVHGPDGQPLDARALGGILRSSELTMNIDPTFLFGQDGAIGDTAWKNAFHLADQGITPRGKHYLAFRDEIERSVFPELSGQPARANERPLYAALNTTGNLSGAASNYGSCVFVLRPETARRCTYTVDDTFVTVPMQFDRARVDVFTHMLDTLPPDALPGLPADVRDTLRNPDSELRRNLGAALGRVPDGAQITLKQFEQLVEEGGVPGEKLATGHDWVRPLLVRGFGDTAMQRDRTATFDTLETLLPHLGEVDGGSLLRAGATGQHKFALQGRYIEAQVQGTFLPSRDVAEIRMDVGDLLNWQTHGVNTDKMRGIVEFARANDIKLTFTDFTGVKDLGPWQRQACAQLQAQGVSILGMDDLVAARTDVTQPEAGLAFARSHQSVAETRAQARALVSGDGEELNARLLSLLPPDSGLAEVPLAGAALDRVKSRFLENVERAITSADAEGRGVNMETVLSDAIRAAAERPITQKTALLRDMETLHFDNEAQRAAFRSWVISARALTTPLEMRMIHANAMAQVARMERLGPNPPLDALAREFATGVGNLGVSIDAFRAQTNPEEFGPDDVFTEFNRTAFMAATLLHASNPALAGSMLEALESPAARNLRGVCFKLHDPANDPLFPSDGLSTARFLGDFMNYTATGLAQQLDRPKPQQPGFAAPLDYMPPTVRGALGAAIPGLGAALDTHFPAKAPRTIAPFPAPTTPGGLATATQTQRRTFFTGMLERYRHHEDTFDGDVGVHGMGHACRGFIFANVMANIMRERSVPVDKNAVLCGIAAHDSGRESNGSDVYETQSADIGLQAMRTAFGVESFGEAFETQYRLQIDDPDHRDQHRPLTAEALLMQSADSLDISRTQDFDPARFPFLREPVTLPDGRILPQDDRLRELLTHEAALLQRLTDPAVYARPLMHDLMLQMGEAPDPSIPAGQLGEVKAAVRQELAELRTLDNDAYLARVEDALRTHAHEMPLLSRYYFQAD
uniref:Uncharacterized protein n=1 Tax=Nitratidesulfovibrio vulgaris (strain DSM 19637 / Miyazaki F) TaxID=883 RepID=B8DQR3_NITV9